MLPTSRETLILVLSLAFWLLITALCVGFRPEHLWLALLIAALFLVCPATRRLVVALMPFIIFGISYDWMNIVHNYEVNPVDILGINDAERLLFGIPTASGTLTPNEFFALHRCTLMDFLGGVFYLCWVPVPIAFGLWLYFKGQEKRYLHFALVFLLVNFIGFAGYYIHPAAPPWYIAKYGPEFLLGTPGDVAGLGACGARDNYCRYLVYSCIHFTSLYYRRDARHRLRFRGLGPVRACAYAYSGLRPLHRPLCRLYPSVKTIRAGSKKHTRTVSC